MALVCAAALAWPAGAWAESASLRPANLKPALDTPEAGLWGESDQAEAYAKTSAELDTDPALNGYVRQIICKVAREYCPELRVYVLDRPIMNAQAAPNGYVEVWSGLLLRARTEDELGFVLGHEVTHFARNHSIDHWNATKRTANTMLVFQLAVAAGATAAAYSTARTGGYGTNDRINSISNAAQSLNNLIYLTGISFLFAYSREQEAEADRLGFERATAAGYDKTAGQRIWSETIAEQHASDFPDVRKQDARASAFNTHPLDADRLATLRTLAGGAAPAPDIDGAMRYRAVIRPHLGAWLKDDLRRRDFGQTLFLIEQLAELNQDMGVLEYYRGEAYRQRRMAGDEVLAVKAYQTAVTYPDAPDGAWRELGDCLRRAGQKDAAAEAFGAYLKRAPQAEDHWLVEASLKNLNGGVGK